MRAGGDARGAPHERELVRVLDQAHLVDQRAHVLHALGRGDAGARLRAHRVQPAHRARVPVGVGAQRVVQRRLVLEQLGQRLVELVDRMRLVEAEALARRLRPVAEAVPDLALRVLLAAEQDALAARAGDDHQHRFGLGEAGEVVEVAVEAVGIVRVAVAHALGRGRDHGDAGAASLARAARGARR